MKRKTGKDPQYFRLPKDIQINLSLLVIWTNYDLKVLKSKNKINVSNWRERKFDFAKSNRRWFFNKQNLRLILFDLAWIKIFSLLWMHSVLTQTYLYHTKYKTETNTTMDYIFSSRLLLYRSYFRSQILLLT